MEHLHYRFSGRRAVAGAHAHIVGVVASGNLEVLIEPAALEGACTVDIDTAASGFGAVWHAVVADFFERHPLADVRISINDNGATPAIVALRLDQAAEEFAGVPRPEDIP
jgi:malonate decarboxylase delta subunit